MLKDFKHLVKDENGEIPYLFTPNDISFQHLYRTDKSLRKNKS